MTRSPRMTQALAPADEGGFHMLEAVFVLFLLAAVAGGFPPAFRRDRALPVVVPVGLAWAGPGAVACRGGRRSLASLGGAERSARAA
ncbi:hypothetical protein [Streptomyces sp. NPDC007991]|uniref:hypothetical protein n=1 Tax=Streptomyces sp. NPDC007991 TaxID=3364803 RepID=UPI0036F00255